MCGLRTFSCAIPLCLLVLLQAPAGSAQTADLHTFASCAGRLSALMEHQWLLSDPASERTARQRDAMVSLVAAMTLPGDEVAARSWRIEAKAAQADLLSRARFTTPKTAAQAARRSDELLAMCRSLLLG